MAIRFDEGRGIFHIDTAHTSYQMQKDGCGVLLHLYYGARVEDPLEDLVRLAGRGFSGTPYEMRDHREYSLDLMPQEYSGNGTGDYRVPAIQVHLENGSRSVELRYVTHRIVAGREERKDLPFVRDDGSMETLVIVMQDAVSGMEVELNYRVLPEKDIIIRSDRIINQGSSPFRIEKAASACIDFPYADFDLLHFHGRHCMERQAERMPVPHGITSLGSTRGMSSHHHNPFIILCESTATENTGDCYGFMLMYSGNHLEEIERDQIGSVRVVTGIHPDGFRWTLNPGEAFETPEAILSFSANGLNGLSGQYHRLIRENVINPRYRTGTRPVLINSWEAAYFNFDAEKIVKFARDARELGAEMLVLDDGWFGHRQDDNTSLGDWTVNEGKLGCTMAELSDRVHALGMQLGLWFEPEMISEDSDLYRAHPDWVLADPDRKPELSRNQLVLDMSRQDVVDYLFEAMCTVLDSAKIEYVKWDFNRSVSNVYSHGLPPERQGEVLHRFMMGTYQLLDRLLKRYPDLLIEGCSGGGGRFDAGMLFYCPQIWCSDDTDAIERLEIQRGTSYGYPVCTMGAHVSAVPNHQTGRTAPMTTRGVVAQSGTFGYELDPGKLTADEKEMVRLQISDFHRFEQLIREGSYYRLTELGKNGEAEAWMFVSPDRAEALVSFVCTHTRANGAFPLLRLRGLDEKRMYRLEGTDVVRSGAAWMKAGYPVKRPGGDYPAIQLHLMAE